MADDDEKESQLLSDSQFELEASDGKRGGIGRIIIFFGGSLLIAAALATIALYTLQIGPFEAPPAPLQADVQPLPPAPTPAIPAAPTPAPPPAAIPEPAKVVEAKPAPEPKAAKGKKAKAAKPPAKKKKKK